MLVTFKKVVATGCDVSFLGAEGDEKSVIEISCFVRNDNSSTYGRELLDVDDARPERLNVYLQFGRLPVLHGIDAEVHARD